MATRINIAGRATELLHVEDNPGDVALVKELLKGAGFPVRVSVARDGEEALAFLRRRGPFSASPRPDVILLDLHLPKKDGLEVLSEIKQDRELKDIPVFILSNSESEAAEAKARRLKADLFMGKPMDMRHFAFLAKRLRDFWIRTFRIQPSPEPPVFRAHAVSAKAPR